MFVDDRSGECGMRLLRLLGPVDWVVGALVGLQLLVAAGPVLQALAVGHLVAVLVHGPFGAERLVVAAGPVAGTLLLGQLSWQFFLVLRTRRQRRIDGRIRATVRDLAVRMPRLDQLEDPAFHDRAARAVDGGIALARSRSAGNAALSQLELIFQWGGGLAAVGLLATFSPVLAVVLLAVAVVVRRLIRRQWLRQVDMLDTDVAGTRWLTYVSGQAVYGAAKDVRLFGLSDWLSGRFRAGGMRVQAPVWRDMARIWRQQWWIAVLMVGASAAALAVPASAVLDGRLAPARLITCVLAAGGILSLVNVGYQVFDIEYGLRGVRALDDLVAEFGVSVAPPEKAVPDAPPTIRFEDVVYRYPGADRPTIDGLSLTLHPGQVVAVVGENGVGKTTFVKLLAGLYRPESGRITVDGVDLTELDPAGWRLRVTVLFQDFLRYPASLRDNVAPAGVGRGGDAAVRDALDRAGGTGLLDRLPDGLDASLWSEGTGGTDLSGGQWQRVALARALFAVADGHRVLVLDEPTAHLDVRAEAEFHERVVSTVSGASTVLISHRLSTVRPADRIVLLSAGRVAEDGSHDELMALGGAYARFFTTQAETFR